MLTYSERKSFAKTGAASLNATVAAAVAEVEADFNARWAANKAAYAKLIAPVAFTPEELQAAKAIRTSIGWHRVVRVNAKSVTVDTVHSWTDRYTLDRILEVR